MSGQDRIDEIMGYRVPKPKPFAVGTYGYGESAPQRLGKVVEVFEHNGETLYSLHYFDTSTGLLMTCPDHRRCGSKGHTCPIHGANLRHRDFVPMTDRDVEFYRKEGMIS